MEKTVAICVCAFASALWCGGCRDEAPPAADLLLAAPQDRQVAPPEQAARQERPTKADQPSEGRLEEAKRFLSKCSANEKDLIEGLRQLATYNDGQFPKEMKLDKQIFHNLRQAKPSKDQANQFAETYKRMIMFRIGVAMKGEASHYAGAGVKLGDAETAVFWYKPKDSEAYKVIYGDLSIKDVAEEDLPTKPDDATGSE